MREICGSCFLQENGTERKTVQPFFCECEPFLRLAHRALDHSQFFQGANIIRGCAMRFGKMSFSCSQIAGPGEQLAETQSRCRLKCRQSRRLFVRRTGMIEVTDSLVSET